MENKGGGDCTSTLRCPGKPEATESIGCGVTPLDRVCFNSCDGSASLIGGCGSVGSCDIDDAEEPMDLRLLVRAADRTEGSELVDETDGDSLPGS